MPGVETLYPYVGQDARAMVFVDGENLALRYGAMLGGKPLPANAAGWYRAGVAVWAQSLNPAWNAVSTRVVRKYYFTSEQGDDDKRLGTADWLKSRGFEQPRVFRRDKERGSKQVDISLSVEMLIHATRRHYQVAVLVAGDEDYVPLVRAVQGEGALVHVWFVSNGLSHRLRREADYFVDLDPFLNP